MWISHSWSNVWFIHSRTSVWTHGLLSYSTDYDLYYHLFWCSNYATIWPLGATGSWLLCPLTWPHPSISTIVHFLTKQNSQAHLVLSLSQPWKQPFPKKPRFLFLNGIWKPDHDTPFVGVLLLRPVGPHFLWQVILHFWIIDGGIFSNLRENILPIHRSIALPMDNLFNMSTFCINQTYITLDTGIGLVPSQLLFNARCR